MKHGEVTIWQQLSHIAAGVTIGLAAGMCVAAWQHNLDTKVQQSYLETIQQQAEQCQPITPR